MTGVGTVLGRPDTMTVTIGVNVVRPTVSEATAEATASATALFDALEAAGVAEQDIQTQNYSIWPQYRYDEGRAPELTGYQVSNTVLAKIRDVDAAGSVIDAAVAAGGDTSVVQGIGFSVEDDTERLAEARAKAFADARAKAEQLAELAGVELGRGAPDGGDPGRSVAVVRGRVGGRRQRVANADPARRGDLRGPGGCRVRDRLTPYVEHLES